MLCPEGNEKGSGGFTSAKKGWGWMSQGRGRRKRRFSSTSRRLVSAAATDPAAMAFQLGSPPAASSAATISHSQKSASRLTQRIQRRNQRGAVQLRNIPSTRSSDAYT